MTENNNRQKLTQILTGIIVLANFLLGLWAYPHLPEQVPSHWNAAGQVDGYTNALGGAFALPGIMAVVYIALMIIPRIDPKKENYRIMKRPYWITSFAIILLFSGLNIFSLWTALSNQGSIGEMSLPIVNWMVGILFIILGNYMGKIKPNYTFGIRTPWTLANEEVWKKTHRFGGPLMMAGGAGILIASFLPIAWRLWVMIAVVLVIALIPTIYSYIQYKAEQL